MALTANILSEQTVEVVVNGPNDIARMFTIAGIAEGSLNEFADVGERQFVRTTFEAHVGPELTTSEFRRAVATASLANISLSGGGGSGSLIAWSVPDVDADFDDDVGKVQLQYDLAVSVVAGATSTRPAISGVGFQVIILAASAGH